VLCIEVMLSCQHINAICAALTNTDLYHPAANAGGLLKKLSTGFALGNFR
jgi:hypothetical protein